MVKPVLVGIWSLGGRGGVESGRSRWAKAYDGGAVVRNIEGGGGGPSSGC